MKKLIEVVFVVAMMVSLYSCSDDMVSSTPINQEEMKSPIYMGNTHDGNLIVSYDTNNIIINFEDIPDNVSNVKIGVFVDEIVGEPSEGNFLVNNFIPIEGEIHTWNWETFYIDYNPDVEYYVYIQFNVGNNVGWVGRHTRTYSGGILRWVESKDCK
jgi:hypothetical protein